MPPLPEESAAASGPVTAAVDGKGAARARYRDASSRLAPVIVGSICLQALSFLKEAG